MTAEQKIEQITIELSDIASCDMTDAELKIREIICEKKATIEEKRKAMKNTTLIMEN